jgi:hypothetical protein
MMPHPQASRSSVADRIGSAMARYAVYTATDAEVLRGRDLAAELIGPDIATQNALQAVHQKNGLGMFVFRQEGVAQGFLGAILLRASGLAKIADDSFDALNPDLEDVCDRGEAPAAVYAWGFVAANRIASAAMVRGMMALRDDALPTVPFFCRAATPEGAKVILGKMGYAPYPPSKTAILFKPAEVQSMECAA